MSENTIVSKKARRVYPYKGANLICFAGARFQSPEDSEIDELHPVNKVEGLASGDSVEVKVTQSLEGQRPRTETWSLFDVNPSRKAPSGDEAS